MKTLSILSLWLASCILSLGAGAINGVTYSAWNGVEISSWNGSGVSASASGGGGGGGGYALVIEGSKAGNSAGVTTDDADTSTATLQIIWAIYYNGTPSLTDSKSNTWTGLTAYTGGGLGNYAVKIYYCAGGTVGSGHTYTLSGSTYSSIIYASFSKTTPSFDTGKDSGAETGIGTTIQPASLTPSTSNCLIVTGATWASGGTASIDSGFTQIDAVSNIDVGTFRATAAYKIQTTATAESPAWTQTDAGAGAGAMAVFK